MKVLKWVENPMILSYGHSVSWEPEGRYQYLKMFSWELEGGYHYAKSMVIAPFWFSTEHIWIVIVPFWLSTDDSMYVQYDAHLLTQC